MTDVLPGDVARWGALVGFCLVNALAFAAFGVAFRLAGLSDASGLPRLLQVLLNPWFIGGLMLAFAGAAARPIVFQFFGISRTVVVSELTLVISLGLSWAIFREVLRPNDLAGAALIGLGVLLTGL